MRGDIDQMATDDGFQPDRPPIFLSGLAEETERPDIGKGRDIATISSRIFKTSILAVVVTAIGIAVLSVGNPIVLVANVTDWWIDKPALQPEADPSTSPIQTIADTQDAPAATTDAPARDEIAAAVEPADQSQAETGQRQAEPGQAKPRAAKPRSLRAKPRRPASHRSLVQAIPGLGGRGRDAGTGRPAQAAPVRVAQDAPAQARPAKKHRRVRSVQNARAEIRPQRHHRARVREEQQMHGNRSRPWPTPGHRIRLCKMPSHRRSCKALVFATRSGGKRCWGEPGIARRAELQKALPMERLFMLRSVGRVERLVRRSSTSEGGSDTHHPSKRSALRLVGSGRSNLPAGRKADPDFRYYGPPLDQRHIVGRGLHSVT